MESLARALVNRRIAAFVVVVSLLGTLAAVLSASTVEHDDDLLAFLPKDNEDVALFQAINRRFGGLDVALVGIEAPDLFEPAFLARLQEATEELDDLEQVSVALSITNLEDVAADPEVGGIRMAALVDRIPETVEDAAALRARVMSRDHVLGRFVSATGDAALIYAFAGHGSDPKLVAEQVRSVMERHFPDHALFWGGAPFISTWIYETTQADMKRLTPWAIAAILVILLITFRDPLGVALSLISTGMGIAAANGLMGLFDVQFNIVLSSMPILLFALGSAYSIHILARYYSLEQALGGEEALICTLRDLGPVVLAAGGTTMAGLLSFIVMDIEPMRSFGLYTALGIGTTLVLSVTFVPAVIRLLDLKGRPPGFDLSGPTVALVFFTRKHRGLVGGVLAVLALASVGLVSRVDARMDNDAFFDEGSPPDQADRFLSEHFGGSLFIQIPVSGDFRQPEVLRHLRFVADSLLLLDGVTSTTHIADTVAIANEAMEGTRRVPDSSEKVALLLGFMAGNKAISQMVNDDRSEALITVKIDRTDAVEVAALLAGVEQLVDDLAIESFTVVSAEEEPQVADVVLMQQVTTRLRAVADHFGVLLDGPKLQRLKTRLGNTAGEPDPATVQAAIRRFLDSDENLAMLPDDQPALWDRVAAATVSAGPGLNEDGLRAALLAAGLAEDDATVDDLLFSLETPLVEAWSAEQTRAAAGALLAAVDLSPPSGADGARFEKAVADTLADLAAPKVLRAASPDVAAGTLSWAVNGLPVLHRGLSASVTANQWRSLSLALVLVLLIMMALFRSPLAGLLATTPTVLTLLFVYGGMGALGVTLDIGTSMLASLIVGAGVDYAVHLISAWKAEENESVEKAAVNATASTAVAIWANAFMVSAGFFVLTLGDAKPLQNVGALTAAAMLTAGLCTFLAIPALARRRSYRKGGGATPAIPIPEIG